MSLNITVFPYTTIGVGTGVSNTVADFLKKKIEADGLIKKLSHLHKIVSDTYVLKITNDGAYMYNRCSIGTTRYILSVLYEMKPSDFSGEDCYSSQKYYNSALIQLRKSFEDSIKLKLAYYDSLTKQELLWTIAFTRFIRILWDKNIVEYNEQNKITTTKPFRRAPIFLKGYLSNKYFYDYGYFRSLTCGTLNRNLPGVLLAYNYNSQQWEEV